VALERPASGGIGVNGAVGAVWKSRAPRPRLDGEVGAAGDAAPADGRRAEWIG
jgi:hypothetical protein